VLVLVLVLVLDLKRVADLHVVLTDPADFVTMCSGPQNTKHSSTSTSTICCGYVAL
jgi:hypothetical protein